MLWPRFKAFFLDMSSEKKYRTLAIISCGLYIFYPFFNCGLYCPSVSKESGFSLAVNITDNLCTKKGNSQIRGLQLCAFKSRVGYDGAHTVIKI